MKLNERMQKAKKALQDKANEIKVNISKCGICNGRGLNSKNISFGEMSFMMPAQCVCSELDDIDMITINEKLELIKKVYNYIDNDVPSIFRDNLYTIHEVDNFLKDNTKKIFWAYSLAKGTGKTTLSYSAAAYNKAINKSHVTFYKEKSLKFNSFNQEYEIDIFNNEFLIIDDVGTNNKRLQALIDFYYYLFDELISKSGKLFITSQYSITEWIQELEKVDKMQAGRIESRLKSMVIEKEITRSLQ